MKKFFTIICIAFTAMITIGIFLGQPESEISKNKPIEVIGFQDNINLDYHSTSYNLSLQLTNLSGSAQATINGDTARITTDYTNNSKLFYRIKDLKEGPNQFVIKIKDGSHQIDKNFTIHRQTRQAYLENLQTTRASETKQAQPQQKLSNPPSQTTTYHQASQSTVKPASQPTVQPQPTPQSTRCPKNCTEAKAMGMNNITTNHPCYSYHLDRDRDGIACDK